MQDTLRSYDQGSFYSPAELQEHRRDAILRARTLRPGAERNQFRQIAMSLKGLAQTGDWLTIRSNRTDAAIQS